MSKHYFPPDRAHHQLMEDAVNALLATRKRVRTLLQDGTGLEQPKYAADDGSEKVMLEVDKAAENECSRLLVKAYGEKAIRVLGEETLWKFKELDLRTQRLEGYGRKVRKVERPETRITAIIDMIDGSDLVERNLGNWCSAMIVFRPAPEPSILFSLIQTADDTIYGADEAGTFLIPARGTRGEPLEELKGPELRRADVEASTSGQAVEDSGQIAVCYYGQKYDHFVSVPPGILRWAKECRSKKRLRFYNLAGNPMMARLANGDNIHVVFEHVGQYPHDAAPGAFIALQAGAHLVDFDGRNIAQSQLAIQLMKPSGAKLRYILASTGELASQMITYLREDKAYFECSQECGETLIASRNESHPRCSKCGKVMRIHERRLRLAS